MSNNDIINSDLIKYQGHSILFFTLIYEIKISLKNNFLIPRTYHVDLYDKYLNLRPFLSK